MGDRGEIQTSSGEECLWMTTASRRPPTDRDIMHSFGPESWPSRIRPSRSSNFSNESAEAQANETTLVGSKMRLQKTALIAPPPPALSLLAGGQFICLAARAPPQNARYSYFPSYESDVRLECAAKRAFAIFLSLGLAFKNAKRGLESEQC